jgi:signal transduction histidine kinase
LAARIAVLCLVVAVVVAVVAGLLSVRLVGGAASDVTTQVLSSQADVVAGQIADGGPGWRAGLLKVVEVLRGQGVTVVLVAESGALTSTDPLATQAARQAGAGRAAGGARVSTTVTVAGSSYVVAARGTPNGGFALVQRADTGAPTVRRLVRDVLLALAIGLGVAGVAGVLLGRLLARPLRATARAAQDIGAGRRDVRVPVTGPAEVAELAVAVNGLVDALDRSESRQREFLLSVSHELRTPLTAVRGFAESLADGVVEGDEVPEVGRTIHDEAHRLDRLVSDLLELAEVDLTDVVRTAGQVWADRCRRAGLPFTLQVGDHPVVRVVDAQRLRQVVDGLLENAVRVTPSGRPIVLALHAGPHPVLQVRDGGPGLAESDYAVAFQRGALHRRYQGSRPVGTGVGLALVHGIVTRHGGTITAGPAPEGGAAFTVTLP